MSLHCNRGRKVGKEEGREVKGERETSINEIHQEGERKRKIEREREKEKERREYYSREYYIVLR